MAEKVFISIDIPVRFKLITNGERVIEQAGPDEISVDVRESGGEGLSWIRELGALLEEAEREMRKSRRRKGQGVADFDSRRSPKRWDQKTTEANKAAKRTEVAPTERGGGTKTTALIARN